MFDLIGDIHGHADELVILLEQLGYDRQQGHYSHPTRKAVFVGDFIDRGRQILQVLEIVHPMIESGAALAVMGNHEFNALAFHTPDPLRGGAFLRPHSEKNVHQHQATQRQLSQAQLLQYLAWFRTLPLWLDLDGIRVVHACWDDELQRVIDAALPTSRIVDYPFLHDACDRQHPLFHAVDVTLKGKEAELPEGMTFFDKDGHARTAVRAKWYLPPNGHTYRTYALQSDPIMCDLPLASSVSQAARLYPLDGEPIFIGHYWLSAERPTVLAPNVARLDYSVAKGGLLVAYRWNGERELSPDNFVAIPAKTLTP